MGKGIVDKPSQEISEASSSDSEGKREPRKAVPLFPGFNAWKNKTVGRKRGANVRKWTFNEANTVFKYLVSKCPPAVNGKEVLAALKLKLPDRSEVAIQTYISHKLHKEIRNLMYVNYGKDFSCLSRRQRLFLAAQLCHDDTKLQNRLISSVDQDCQTETNSEQTGVPDAEGHASNNNGNDADETEQRDFRPQTSSTPFRHAKRRPSPSVSKSSKSMKVENSAVVQEEHSQAIDKCDSGQGSMDARVRDSDDKEATLKAEICTITAIRVFKTVNGDEEDDDAPFLVQKKGDMYTITPNQNWSCRAENGHLNETGIQDFINQNDVVTLTDPKSPPLKELSIRDKETAMLHTYKALFMKTNDGVKFPVLFATTE